MHHLPCAFSAPRMLTSCARFCGLMRPQPRASLPLALIRRPWARPSEPPSPDSPELHFARDFTLEGRRPIRAAAGAYPLSQKPRPRDHHPFGATAVEDLSAFHRIVSAKLRFTASSQEPTPSPFGCWNRPAHLFHPLSTRPHRPGCARVSFRLRPAPFFATRTAMRPTSVCQPKLP